MKEIDGLSILDQDYNGLANLLNAFVKLYEVSGDKESVDKVLKNFANPKILINTDIILDQLK
jgi:hypothetical protein